MNGKKVVWVLAGSLANLTADVYHSYITVLDVNKRKNKPTDKEWKTYFGQSSAEYNTLRSKQNDCHFADGISVVFL